MGEMIIETHVAEFGASRLHYQVSGERGDLPDIVLEHGGGGSADDWNQVVPVLAAQGRVIRYDRAGMGDSPSDGLGCSASAVSTRLAQLVEQAGVRKPFVLVGYSLGGLYARYYAQQHPQDVAALVLVDTTPTALEIPKAKIDQAMRIVAVLHWAARSGVGSLFWYLGGRKTPAEKFKRMVRRLGAPGYLQRMREEMGAIAGIQADVARDAPQLQHPTLALVAGDAPKNMTADEAVRVRGLHEQLAATAPAPLSRMVVVQGANHGTLMSNPQHAAELARQMSAFVRSLPSAP